MRVQSRLIRNEQGHYVLEAVKKHLNVSLENVPTFVQEEVVLQTLVNLRTVFKQHPHFKNSKQLQAEVLVIEGFIEQLS